MSTFQNLILQIYNSHDKYEAKVSREDYHSCSNLQIETHEYILY